MELLLVTQTEGTADTKTEEANILLAPTKGEDGASNRVWEGSYYYNMDLGTMKPEGIGIH